MSLKWFWDMPLAVFSALPCSCVAISTNFDVDKFRLSKTNLTNLGINKD